MFTTIPIWKAPGVGGYGTTKCGEDGITSAHSARHPFATPLSVTTVEISRSEIFLSQTLFRGFRAFRVSAFSTLLYSQVENAESAEKYLTYKFLINERMYIAYIST